MITYRWHLCKVSNIICWSICISFNICSWITISSYSVSKCFIIT
nr:MAG TPA: hypothetical protein [Caudoviricetes sp.]